MRSLVQTRAQRVAAVCVSLGATACIVDLDGLQSPEAAGSYRDAVLADGPSAYWRLGDGAAPKAEDASGHGRGATYVGSVSLGVTGAIANDPDRAVGFDAFDQKIVVDDPDAFAFPDLAAFSIEGWYRFELDEAFHWLFSRHDEGEVEGEGYYAYVSPDDGEQTYISVKRATTSVAQPSAIWIEGHTQSGRWSHIVVTYDGTTMTLFVDGVTKETSSQFSIQGAASPFAIGNRGGANAGDGFHGAIDEFAVYEKALTLDRILAHYRLGIGAP